MLGRRPRQTKPPFGPSWWLSSQNENHENSACFEFEGEVRALYPILYQRSFIFERFRFGSPINWIQLSHLRKTQVVEKIRFGCCSLMEFATLENSTFWIPLWMGLWICCWWKICFGRTYRMTFVWVKKKKGEFWIPCFYWRKDLKYICYLAMCVEKYVFGMLLHGWFHMEWILHPCMEKYVLEWWELNFGMLLHTGGDSQWIFQPLSIAAW